MLRPRALIAVLLGAATVGFLIGRTPLARPTFWILVPFAVALIYTDVRHRRLPELITLPALAAAAGVTIATGHAIAAAISVLVVGGMLAVMYVFANVLFDEHALGFGDVVAGAITGVAFVDFASPQPSFTIGLYVMAGGLGIAFLYELIVRRRGTIPLGAYLMGSLLVGGWALMGFSS